MQAIAQALLEGDCFTTNVATAITAVTGAEFEVIEGCERGDFAAGDASGSTDGSTAEGVCSPSPMPQVLVFTSTAVSTICAYAAIASACLIQPMHPHVSIHRHFVHMGVMCTHADVAVVRVQQANDSLGH